MSNDNALVVKSLERSLTVTSLADLVRIKSRERVALLLDCSGSMSEVMRNGKRRIEGLHEVVADVIRDHPHVKLIAFNGDGVAFVNAPWRPSGNTPLHAAIEFARNVGLGHAIVISDGYPDRPNEALNAARAFGGRIDVVFVGNPGESGEEFLRQLADAAGGCSFTGDLSAPKELVGEIAGLLTAGDDDDDE
jgi:Mg-chelatase subunit ChlD